MPKTSVSVSTANTFSDPIRIVGGFNISISGTYLGNITLQRSENGTTWNSIQIWSAPVQRIGFDPILNYYRIGSLSWATGTAVASINGYDVWPNRI